MAENSSIYSVPDARKLPASEEVNIAALARLFADTTNSYKYIFFISILDILKRRNFDVSQDVSLDEIIVEMLANAWYPHTYFKLSFGTRDKIAESLDLLNLKVEEPVLKFTDTDKKLLRSTIEGQNLKKISQRLKRYVPFRLIVPFLESELQGIEKKSQGNNLDIRVPKVAETYFGDLKPLYRFNSDSYSSCNAIILHPSWANYLEKHYSIVRGWASWEWLSYMQKRNPNTPGIIHKLFAPNKRESLSKQTTYWRRVLENTDFYCIYSNQKIEPDKFSLDHYLPWSFVAHDQLWNLVPTTPEVNSSKSNDLPPSTFFDKFVSAQHLSLRISHEKMAKAEWRKTTETYIDALRIPDQDALLDIDTLRSSYDTVINPLLSIATNQGFKLWQPSPAA
ncbi:HNH endonuclease domain-containing protein [Leptolyngbya ohadii]|uniref:HNH endonuclease domain-containing protein n=1 Tax=Leptolyngbya ohadii TaxID=1962290 RepID=UPI000B59ECF5|nr:HNH endonuclease domain-containing protein [Leptolyngbya ohadii]